jgi:hypothetical protein
MSNHFTSNRLTSNYLLDTIRSFEIERFDIEQRETDGRAGEDEMDAVTSYELEAQRRRETVAGDRDLGWSRMKESIETIEARIVEPHLSRRRLEAQPDCEPAPLARQVAG